MDSDHFGPEGWSVSRNVINIYPQIEGSILRIVGVKPSRNSGVSWTGLYNY